MKKIILLCSFFILLFYVSCSSEPINNYQFEDEYVSVICDIDNYQNTLFDLTIKNNSDENILLLFAEAKVSNSEGNMVSFISEKEALSIKNTIQINNKSLKSKETFNDKYMAVGYVKKQILSESYVLLPWIERGKFKLEIPYVIRNIKKNIEINL